MSLISILTREALYDQVWNGPLSKLAEAFGTNGACLKKLCVEAAIPLPTSGHWQRLRAGTVTRPILPPRPPGASVIITIGHYRTWWRSEREMLSDPLPVKPEFPESVETIVANAIGRLGSAPHQSKACSFHVRQPLRRRQQNLMEELRFNLSRVGAELHISRRERGKMQVRSGAINLSFALTQQPDGLRLDLYAGQSGERIFKTFLDEEDRPLESRLLEIITAMMTAVEIQYRERAMQHYAVCFERRADAERDARERRAAAKRLWEQRRVERAERETELLLSQARNWRTAHDIRGFVADIMKQAENEPAGQALAPWADWALGQADLIDPVKQGALLHSRPKEHAEGSQAP